MGGEDEKGRKREPSGESPNLVSAEKERVDLQREKKELAVRTLIFGLSLSSSLSQFVDIKEVIVKGTCYIVKIHLPTLTRLLLVELQSWA